MLTSKHTSKHLCIPKDGGLDEKWTEPSVKDFENEIKMKRPSGSHNAPYYRSVSKYHSFSPLQKKWNTVVISYIKKGTYSMLSIFHAWPHATKQHLTIMLINQQSYVLSHNRVYRDRSRSSRQRPWLWCPRVCFPKAKCPITVIATHQTWNWFRHL